MQYRQLGNTGHKVSLLGMGCMRLPFINGDGNNGVDVPAAIEQLQYAADNGINYFDTAFGYHGGQSEAILGEALESRRNKVLYITKQPSWEMHDIDTLHRNFENTLKKLRTDYIDAYLMHRVMPTSWSDIKERKLMDEFQKLKEQGLIRHVGCSYHGNYDHFKQVVEEYPWELILVQHNMLDINREVTRDGIEFAAKKGIGLSIMEPLRGGGLAHAPEIVQNVYNKSDKKRTPAEWALRYLADIPQISAIVSGMTTMEQLKQNIELFSQPDMTANHMSEAEKQTIVDARKAYESIVTIPCTACDYCVPCPQGVQIPNIFRLYNDAHRFGHKDQPRRGYMFATRANGDATKCNKCGACLKRCPQGVKILQELETSHEFLKGWSE